MSKKFRLDRKIGFRNMFKTKCITVIIDSIGPSIILRSIIQIFKYFPKNIFYISIVLKILWKMEHLLLRSKCSIFHNILKNLTFQRHSKALVWSKGLTKGME